MCRILSNQPGSLKGIFFVSVDVWSSNFHNHFRRSSAYRFHYALRTGQHNGIHWCGYILCLILSDIYVVQGIPLIVIPVMGDQTRNAYQVERNGIGLRLDKTDLADEKKLEEAIREILGNERFCIPPKSNIFQFVQISHQRSESEESSCWSTISNEGCKEFGFVFVVWACISDIRQKYGIPR